MCFHYLLGGSGKDHTHRFLRHRRTKMRPDSVLTSGRHKTCRRGHEESQAMTKTTQTIALVTGGSLASAVTPP